MSVNTKLKSIIALSTTLGGDYNKILLRAKTILIITNSEFYAYTEPSFEEQFS